MATDHADIQLFFSNRLENLADALIEQLAKSHASYLATDTFLVQSRGMSRWLNLRIADRTGIQMNGRYLYPRALIDLVTQFVSEEDFSNSKSHFTPDTLFWKCYKLLPTWANHSTGFTIRRYLSADSQQSGYLRRYQLAQKIAQLMDHLQVYRPDLLSQWEREKEPSSWKSLAWKSLNKSSRQPAFPELLRRFKHSLERLNARPKEWPESIHIFGISSLPPSYLEILKQCSTWMPISIYLTQPSPHYWGDQLSKKRQLRNHEDSKTDLGHGLLGNLGKQGQDFLNTLIDAEIFTSDHSEHFSSNENSSLLSNFQNQIFEVNSPPETRILCTDNESIQVHNCHNVRREIEVLKDQLHARFEANPLLTPDQVIIMAPDIEVYASAIKSVFGRHDRGKDFIPCSIADQSNRSASSVAFALFQLFELLDSRFTANEVVSFLSIPVVTKRFGYKQTDWELLLTWIENTAIRWGIDADQRKKVSNIGFDEYSWGQGIDRWISGYCISSSANSILDDMNPHEDMEGSATALLTRFLDAWIFLKEAYHEGSKINNTSQWLKFIKETVSVLFLKLEDHEEETKVILNLLGELEAESSEMKSDAPMTLKVMAAILEDRLSQDFRAGSFFSGTVTFCSLKPMRNVPAKFIGLIGMNENAFPRRDLKSEFTQFPDGARAGDRSIGGDDRYLFLESLLASREYIYVSHLGIDSQTLDQQPASIVVEELLDSLDDYYCFPDGKKAREALIVREPLQAFSPAYFQSESPSSFSTENLMAANALVSEHGVDTHPFLGSTQTELEPPTEVSLKTFLRFFNNPCRYWLNQSIELNFPYQDSILEDFEPIEPTGLLEYHLGQHLIHNPELVQEGKEYLLKDLLPVGSLRMSAIEAIRPKIKRMLKLIGDSKTEALNSLTVDINLRNKSLRGIIDGVHESHCLKLRFGKVRATDLLSTWIQHLCLCSANDNGTFFTRFVGKEEAFDFSYVGDAKTHLEQLDQLFLDGHLRPLPFFIETSNLYARETLNPNPRSKLTPLNKAFSEFSRNADAHYGRPGEGFERHINLCFPSSKDAISNRFEKIAVTVFEPLYKHMKGIET